jgi:hypothetical protein
MATGNVPNPAFRLMERLGLNLLVYWKNKLGLGSTGVISASLPPITVSALALFKEALMPSSYLFLKL